MLRTACRYRDCPATAPGGKKRRQWAPCLRAGLRCEMSRSTSNTLAKPAAGRIADKVGYRQNGRRLARVGRGTRR
jgi:hypothetical protein